ncbi:hypothetical protein VP01_5531g1, partial [Puccinia sorghi]
PLNLIGPANHISSNFYHQIPQDTHVTFYPISGQHLPFNTYSHNDVTYSTWSTKPKNSVVRLDHNFSDNQRFGRIERIFEHHFRSQDSEKSHMWFVIAPFPAIPSHETNPFQDLNRYAMQVELRLLPNDETPRVIVYGPREVHELLVTNTIGLVSLDR